MDADELRQRRAREIQERFAQQQAEAEAEARHSLQKETLLKAVMTPDAKSRLTRLKLANPMLGEQVEQLIVYLAQSGKVRKIDDTTFKSILLKIKSKRKDITITRK